VGSVMCIRDSLAVLTLHVLQGLQRVWDGTTQKIVVP
jgi:hypothetical protein